jgi:ATP-binding cassette subfamily B protein
MSRIGSETDRICVATLHALDFATDVKMILMTAAIPINPWLGAGQRCCCCPIAWMIWRGARQAAHWLCKKDRTASGRT